MDSVEFAHLSERINNLKKSIEELIVLGKAPALMEHRSVCIDQIAAALATAQLDFQPIAPNRSGIDGQYADITKIMESVSKPLGKQKLKLIQRTEHEGESIFLVTELIHASGQWLSSRIRLIMAATDKETGAHLDFHKRHQALTLLGVYPSNASYDDDGEQQKEESMIKGLRSPLEKAPKNKHWETITKEQYDDLLETLNDYPDIAKDIMERYGITTLRDMPKKSFPEDMKRIRELILKIERRI